MSYDRDSIIIREFDELTPTSVDKEFDNTLASNLAQYRLSAVRELYDI